MSVFSAKSWMPHSKNIGSWRVREETIQGSEYGVCVTETHDFHSELVGDLSLCSTLASTRPGGPTRHSASRKLGHERVFNSK
jgi:hypothetical protein